MNLRVSWRVSLGLVGTTLTYLTFPLAVPLILALYYGEPLAPFLVAIAVTLSLGLGMDSVGTEGELYAREAFLAVSLIWFLIAVIEAIPFVVAGDGVTAHPLNALFELMSGITTTGCPSGHR